MPKVYKLDYGQEKPRKVWRRPARLSDHGTKFEVTERTMSKSSHGASRVDAERQGPVPFLKNVPGTEKVLPAQLVLLAMGFLGPETTAVESLGVERDRVERESPTSRNTTRTSRACSPAAIVVAARARCVGLQRGPRRGARIDRYLMGATNLPDRLVEKQVLNVITFVITLGLWFLNLNFASRQLRGRGSAQQALAHLNAGEGDTLLRDRGCRRQLTALTCQSEVRRQMEVVQT